VTITDLDPSAYLALFAIVAIGSVLPVLPTGAAVSAAAVIAADHEPWAMVPVVLVGALGAYVGDLVTYAALRSAGEPLALRMRWLRRDDLSRLGQVRDGIAHHELRTLVISRLVPAGRLPVLLVAAVAGYPWRRFAAAAVASTLLWSVLYAAIGVAGATVLPDTRTALVVAIGGALLFTAAQASYRRWTDRRGRRTTGLPDGAEQ
jgi:membrane protein DedA with SNARE-associated domain